LTFTMSSSNTACPMELSAIWATGTKPIALLQIPHANLTFQGHALSPTKIPDGDGRARHQHYERAKDWPRYLMPGDVLTFTWVYVASHLRDQVEAALIDQNQPLANESLKDDYPKEPIFVHSHGQIGTLTPDIFASIAGAIMSASLRAAGCSFATV
jgi:hypothetical protein